MVVLKYKNSIGWIKVRYRKIYWLFGQKVYVITGDTCGKRTYMSYMTLDAAASVFNILKKSIDLKEKNEK